MYSWKCISQGSIAAEANTSNTLHKWLFLDHITIQCGCWTGGLPPGGQRLSIMWLCYLEEEERVRDKQRSSHPCPVLLPTFHWLELRYKVTPNCKEDWKV